jgi:NADH-quinone oxidoreductase subunit N
MNVSLLSTEVWVLALGLGLLLLDLWTPPRLKRPLGLVAAGGVGLILLSNIGFGEVLSIFKGGSASTLPAVASPQSAFGGSFVVDPLALFFKRLFLVAALLVLVMASGFADRFEGGAVEYYSLILFALLGMMCAASASHFAVLFVSLELITVTFYVLTSFQRYSLRSLEAGVKYLILGGLSSAFMVYGIALIFGASGTMSFQELATKSAGLAGQPLFRLGLLLVLAGLGFKMAAVPFHYWAPDVYQGAPTPTTTFLAVGSKAAGFVLLLRVLQSVGPAITPAWTTLLLVLAGATILYGNLCALWQTNLKRLLGYSSIGHAGYLLMGVAVMSQAGSAAILFYLAGYLFSVLAALAVVAVVFAQTEVEDIEALAGLHQRSPFLAAAMALGMISLAGIPPLVGFFGKFLLIKAVLEQGATNPAFYGLAAVAVAGVVVSLCYYFGVIRAMYWPGQAVETSPVAVRWSQRLLLTACMGAMLYLGLLPNWLLRLAATAVGR